MAKRKPNDVWNIIVVSDLHCGCQLGLCPPDGVELDEGGMYTPSKIQRKVWAMWEEFWGEWVPSVTRGEPFAVVVNGDALDGVHHGAVHQITHNLSDQAKIAYEVLKPIIEGAEGGYYHIRGTEAHVGKSGQEEERLASSLGAIPNDLGQYARFEAWLRIGPALCHFAHHIGTSGSMAYETSAVTKELQEAYAEAGRWKDEPPDIICRSHRHRSSEVRFLADKGFATSFVTPAWQLRTPFAYKIAGARQATPQIGGSLIRYGGEEAFTRHRIWPIGRSPEEVPSVRKDKLRRVARSHKANRASAGGNR